MTIFAHSSTSRAVQSFEAGLALARDIRKGFAEHPLRGMVVYTTVNHDQVALLRGVREVVGPDVRLIGSSAQGVMTKGSVVEDGYIAGAMGLGGASLDMVTAAVEQFQHDTADKARQLGRALKAQAQRPLRAVFLHYDPLCGADVEPFLQALHAEVGCPIIGGASAEFWGPMQQTFQLEGSRVLQQSAVAAGLVGEFTLLSDLAHGTSPIGIEMDVTGADANKVLAFDGRPALDVWQEFCSAAPEHLDHSGAIGIGLPTSDPDVYLVRCAFGVDAERKAVIFQAGIPVGSTVMFNHRTIEGAVDGTRMMGERLASQLQGKKVRAVLGFECGARTKPFLGAEATLRENLLLQASFGQDAAWLGMLAWGEVHIFDGRAGLVNFSFPLLVLAD